jgi:phosphatidylglycerophosphate synthase
MAASSILPKATHVRVSETLLTPLERPALRWLATRMPRRVTPDHLTALGFVGCALVCAAYVLTNRGAGFLALANLGLALNWLGDSLDGTLARHRRIERPRYGYFLDHTVDSVNMLLVALGLGLSPYVRLDIALLAVAGYYMVSILTYITTHVKGLFRLSYGGVGPTEVRVFLAVANTVFGVFGNPATAVAGTRLTVFDGVALAAAVSLIALFVAETARGARELAELDRPGPV